MRYITLGALAIFLFWISGFGLFVFSSILQKSDIPETDAIVVFTGGPGRIEKGLKFFGQNMTKHLFISGVHPDVKKSEILAKAGKITLPECCISLGKTSTTTTENAVETKKWAEENEIPSILLITSEYHIRRSVLELSSAIPDLEISTYVVREYLPHQSRWVLFFVEYHKTLYRWMQIQLRALFS